MKTDHTELMERLEACNLDDLTAAFPFSERLARENQWPPVFAQRVIREYKRFAFLAGAAGHPVSPSDAIDQAWHLHMIYTKSYWIGFCGEILRAPLHHSPSKGGQSEHDKFRDWYSKTVESYRLFLARNLPKTSGRKRVCTVHRCG